MDGNEYKRLITLIENLRSTVEKDHKMLKKMRRDAIVGRIFKLVFWLIILGFPVAVYYHYKPTVDGYIENYQKVMNAFENIDVPFVD